MPQITLLPSGKSFSAALGDNLLEACRRAGLRLPASCGGKGGCGKCRVRVISGEAPPTPGRGLRDEETAAGWRLACRVRIAGDLTLADPGNSGAEPLALTGFRGREAKPDCRFRAETVKLSPPSLSDQASDLERLETALGVGGLEVSLPLLQRLPGVLRAGEWKATALLEGRRLVEVLPGERACCPLGLAVDVGTTTLAAALLDLSTGKLLTAAGGGNPQAAHGDDVVSRMDYASASPAGAAEMRRLCAEAIDSLAAQVCAAAKIDPELICEITVAGNTAMQHLLLGLDTAGITRSPFIPTLRRGIAVRCCEAGIAAAAPGALLYALPGVSAYVGGDIVAGMLAHAVHAAEPGLLFVDVGTNGEMALHAAGRTLACSTAAGPAFEGARIERGMRAAPGAICAVALRGDDLEIATVAGAPACGICGTGLLDAVAVLLDLGVVDETGRMLDADELREARPCLPEKILARLRERNDGPAFVLAKEEGAQPEVILSQRDVREFQLAKGAIAAGVAVLLAECGLRPADLRRVLLAGGFGSSLKPQSAARVGLLPRDIPPARVEFVGNSSLAGARLCLLSTALREEAERIACATSYLELSGRADFQEAFAENLSFPTE